MENKPEVIIIGAGHGMSIDDAMLANKIHGHNVIIINDDIKKENQFANPPVYKIENTRLYMDEHKKVDYGPVKKSKPKHHNSSWGTPIKKKQDNRKQQRKSRKINRRK